MDGSCSCLFGRGRLCVCFSGHLIRGMSDGRVWPDYFEACLRSSLYEPTVGRQKRDSDATEILATT